MSGFAHTLIALDMVVIVALLGFAAWRDVLTRTIPDSISVALIVVGCAARLCEGWGALGISLLVGVGVFIILLPACSWGLLGGADLKLLGALAVGLSPQMTLHLIAAVTIVGGLLGVIYLGLNRLVSVGTAAAPTNVRSRSWLRRIAAVECWRIRRSAPLPYGVAIAIGAAIVVLNRQGV